MLEINVTELSRHFSDYLNRVFYQGERFTILRGKRPVAQITPIPAAKTLGDLVRLLADAPLLSPPEAEAFAADLAALRTEANVTQPEDPWESS